MISYESVHICQEKRILQQRITMFTLEWFVDIFLRILWPGCFRGLFYQKSRLFFFLKWCRHQDNGRILSKCDTRYKDQISIDSLAYLVLFVHINVLYSVLIYIHVFVWMCDSLYNVKQESCKSLLFCELSNTILWTNKCFGYFSIYPATNTVNSKSVV